MFPPLEKSSSSATPTNLESENGKQVPYKWTGGVWVGAPRHSEIQPAKSSRPRATLGKSLWKHVITPCPCTLIGHTALKNVCLNLQTHLFSVLGSLSLLVNCDQEKGCYFCKLISQR